MYETDKLDPKIEAVFRRILASARATGADKLGAWKKPERDLRRLAKRDYVRALRRNIGYRELKTVTAALEDTVARLDGGRYAWGSLEAMRIAAGSLALHFKAEPYGGDEGLALRGFYADKNSRTLRHPLIFVNTSHAPIAVSDHVLSRVRALSYRRAARERTPLAALLLRLRLRLASRRSDRTGGRLVGGSTSLSARVGSQTFQDALELGSGRPNRKPAGSRLRAESAASQAGQRLRFPCRASSASEHALSFRNDSLR